MTSPSRLNWMSSLLLSIPSRRTSSFFLSCFKSCIPCFDIFLLISQPIIKISNKMTGICMNSLLLFLHIIFCINFLQLYKYCKECTPIRLTNNTRGYAELAQVTMARSSSFNAKKVSAPTSSTISSGKTRKAVLITLR